MTTHDLNHIQKLLESQPVGFSLRREFYKDLAIYQIELTQIFSKHWLYAGHVSQIPDSGDFRTLEVDTESVIIVRTASGDVKAHMNEPVPSPWITNLP